MNANFRISEPSRLLASIRGWNCFPIFQDWLMQLVDFHYFSTFFSPIPLLGERDRPGRRGVRLAPRSGKKDTNSRTVLGGTAYLMTDWISEHSRLLASIRGWNCFVPILLLRERDRPGRRGVR